MSTGEDVLLNEGWMDDFEACWSPEGRSIVSYGSDGDLTVVDVTALGAPVAIVVEAASEAWPASWRLRAWARHDR